MILKKYILITTFFNIIFILFINNNIVFANNSEIIKLKNEINIINKKLEDLEQRKFQTSFLEDIQFHGRLHFEFLHSNNNGNAFLNLSGDSGKNKFDNFRITDSRFSGKKKLSDKSDFIIILKVSNDDIRIKEMYMTYRLVSKLALDLGQVDTPLTLEAEDTGNFFPMTRVSKYYTTGNLFFAKGLGLRLRYLDDNFGIYSGVFGNDYTDNIKNINRLSFNIKTFFNPYKKENNIVHIGLNYIDMIREQSDVAKIPNSPSDLQYDLKRFSTLNGELALNFNWFNLQSEYSRGFVTPTATNYKKTFDLYSYYVQLAFLLTGETFKYRGGAFYGLDVKNPINNGGFGAFELSFRLAKTDLQDKNHNIIFDYGKYTDYSMAFSWYPVNFFKSTIQYSRVDENFKDVYTTIANNYKRKNRYNVISFKNKIFF